uniref:Uncharacterized protein n=1 Tax=Meloidogyne enterolobii TaxID=390850 RepID=A0A6V7U3K9_MELEN|nr:unnamed protein product [Meloidogyne enterolobii]
MSDSVSLNSTGNSIMAQQTQREAALEGVELTGPWAQLWIRTRTFDYLLSNLKNIGRAFLLISFSREDHQNFNFENSN